MVNNCQYRLGLFIKEVFKTKVAFAKALDVNPTWISSYTGKGKSIIRSARLVDKLTKLGLNYDWYLNGTGDMLVSQSDDSLNITENKGVPYYPLDVTASFVRSFNDIQAAPEFYVDFKPLNDCTAYFTVVGDSMYPKYSPGEIIAIKRIVNYDYIQWGETYLVVTSEEANSMRTIKLVYKHPDKNYVILRAANPLYEGDMEVAKEHIIEMFIVKGRVKLENL